MCRLQQAHGFGTPSPVRGLNSVRDQRLNTQGTLLQSLGLLQSKMRVFVERKVGTNPMCPIWLLFYTNPPSSIMIKKSGDNL